MRIINNWADISLMECLGLGVTVLLFIALIFIVVYNLYIHSHAFRRFFYDLKHIDDEPFNAKWMEYKEWKDTNIATNNRKADRKS